MVELGDVQRQRALRVVIGVAWTRTWTAGTWSPESEFCGLEAHLSRCPTRSRLRGVKEQAPDQQLCGAGRQPKRSTTSRPSKSSTWPLGFGLASPR